MLYFSPFIALFVVKLGRTFHLVVVLLPQSFFHFVLIPERTRMFILRENHVNLLSHYSTPLGDEKQLHLSIETWANIAEYMDGLLSHYK